MNLKLSWFYWIGIIGPLNAHEAHQAFFEIQETELKEINIWADFPWTLRDALIQFDSTLLTDKQEVVWSSAFERYVIQNFRVNNTNGNTLKFLSIEELANTHSGHSIRYNFKLEWGIIGEIENRLMFNVNGNQENYHKIIRKDGSVEFVTNRDSPNYLFKENHNSYFYFVISIFVGIFLSLLVLKMSNRYTT